MTDTATELDHLTEALRAVVLRQLGDHDPAHEDFYTWGWALSELTMRLDDVGAVLGSQVLAYGERRFLRDDEGDHPAERLGEAARCLGEMRAALVAANAAARRYHSAIGHIAVEVDPEARP